MFWLLFLSNIERILINLINSTIVEFIQFVPLNITINVPWALNQIQMNAAQRVKHKQILI